ncbi:MAG: DUF1284 domain-containing protein [Bariatricus sp.]|nr:DUF1284 domain-containing protein [Bariatricus sp.]
MELRPHHLLCTQAYSGKGYSDEFVRNMDELTEKLRKNEPVKIKITFSTDDLCACCPNKVGEGKCVTDEKVKRYDQKVVEYFHIEEKEYIYQEITEEIREKMTPEMLEDICEGCSWYPISACRRILAGDK